MTISMKEKMAGMRKMRGTKDVAKKQVAVPPKVHKVAATKPLVPAETVKLPDLHPDILPPPKPVLGAPVRKHWKLKTISDMCRIPDDQITYAMYYIKLELTKAVRAKKIVDFFVYHEGQRLETTFIEDPFGD